MWGLGRRVRCRGKVRGKGLGKVGEGREDGEGRRRKAKERKRSVGIKDEREGMEASLGRRRERKREWGWTGRFTEWIFATFG